MGENQSGVSGDAEGPRPHGLQGFYGREQELAWLRGLWEQAAGRSSDGSACPPLPRLAVIVADSGLGKTRLVQALYQQLSEDPHWDPVDVDYWPAAFQEVGKSLEVNPSMQGHECHGPPRFVWLGMRGRDPNDRNTDSGYTALPGAYEALLAHIATAKRHHGAWATFLDRAGKGIRKEGLGEIAGAAAETVVPFAGLFAKLVKGAFSAMEGLGDRIEGVGERIERQRQDLVEEMLEMLLEVLQRGGAGGRPLPMVLWIDDAQWIDPDALRLIGGLWRAATGDRNLPLFIVCTHWERDWRLLEKALRDAGGELPIGTTSLAELTRRRGGDARVLGKANAQDLGAYLAAHLPGLTSNQRELVLSKADGNFLTMVENVGELLAEPMHFVNDDPRLPLTEPGEEEVRGWELDRERRVAQIFKKLEPRLRESLGWSSRLGVRFLHEVVEEFAAMWADRGVTADGPGGAAQRSGATSGLDECVDPHAILDVPSPYLRIFRDRAWHVAAKRHFAFRSKSTPSLVSSLEEVLKRHLIAWVNNSFDEEGDLIEIPPDESDAKAAEGINGGNAVDQYALPMRAAIRLTGPEQRDLLAVAQSSLANATDWSSEEQRASTRVAVLSILNHARKCSWSEVQRESVGLQQLDWATLPLSCIGLRTREHMASVLADAGAMRVSRAVLRDLVHRYRAHGSPDSVRHYRALVRLLVALGDVEFTEHSAQEEARRHYEDSHAVCTRWLEAGGSEEALRWASTALARIGSVSRQQGNWSDAMLNYQRSLEMRRTVLAMGESAARRRAVIVQLWRVGGVAKSLHDIALATSCVREALSIARITASESDDDASRRDLAIAMEKLGDILSDSGAYGDADLQYLESLTLVRQIAKSAKSSSALVDLAVTLDRLGDVNRSRDRLHASHECFREACDLREQIADDVQTPIARRDLIRSIEAVAESHAGAGRNADARKAWARMLENAKDLFGMLLQPQDAVLVVRASQRLAEFELECGCVGAANDALSAARPIVDSVAHVPDPTGLLIVEAWWSSQAVVASASGDANLAQHSEATAARIREQCRMYHRQQ